MGGVAAWADTVVYAVVGGQGHLKAATAWTVAGGPLAAAAVAIAAASFAPTKRFNCCCCFSFKK